MQPPALTSTACTQQHAVRIRSHSPPTHSSRLAVLCMAHERKTQPCPAADSAAPSAGLVCLELYKVLQKKAVEDFRNTFANLAVPLFAMSEPLPPKAFKFQDMSWTLWDRWVLEGDLSVQDVLEWFRVRLRACCVHLLCGPAAAGVPQLTCLRGCMGCCTDSCRRCGHRLSAEGPGLTHLADARRPAPVSGPRIEGPRAGPGLCRGTGAAGGGLAAGVCVVR